MGLHLNPNITDEQEVAVEPYLLYLDQCVHGSRKIMDSIMEIPPESIYRSMDAVKPMRFLYKMRNMVTECLEPAMKLSKKNHERYFHHQRQYLSEYFDKNSSRIIERLMAQDYEYRRIYKDHPRNIFSVKLDETVDWIMHKWYGSIITNKKSEFLPNLVGRIARNLGQDNFSYENDFKYNIDYDEEKIHDLANSVLNNLYEKVTWDDSNISDMKYYEPYFTRSYGYGYDERNDFRKRMWLLKSFPEADIREIEDHFLDKSKKAIAKEFNFKGTYISRPRLVGVVRKAIRNRQPKEFGLSSHIVSVLEKGGFIDKTGIVVNEDEVNTVGTRRQYGYLPGDEAKDMIPEAYIGRIPIPEAEALWKPAIPKEKVLSARLECIRRVDKALRKHCKDPQYMFLDSSYSAGFTYLDKDTWKARDEIVDEINDALRRYMRLTALIHDA